MLISTAGAPASPVSGAFLSNETIANSSGEPPSEPTREPVRHMLFGSPSALQITIKRLHKLGYAEPNDWSRPISTGRANEVMATSVRDKECRKKGG